MEKAKFDVAVVGTVLGVLLLGGVISSAGPDPEDDIGKPAIHLDQ